MAYRLGQSKLPYGDMWDDSWMQKWYNKNPFQNKGYAPNAETQGRAQQNKLAWDARSIMPAEGPQGHLTQKQMDVLYPFGGGGYTADQASLYRAGPDPGRMPKVLAPQMQENFNTIERANQLGYFVNPGQAYDPAYGLGGIGQRDFYQDSLAPGAWNPDSTGWPSITGYGAADNFAGRGLGLGSGGRSLSGTVNMGADGPEVTVEQGGCTTNKGCPVTGVPHAPNESHNSQIQASLGSNSSGSDVSFAIDKNRTYNTLGRVVEDKRITDIDWQDYNDNHASGYTYGFNKNDEKTRVLAGNGPEEGVLYEENYFDEKPAPPEPAKNPFGDDYPEKDVPITGPMQGLLDSIPTGIMGLQNYMKTGMNHGVIPIPAQQRLAKTYFDPRRESIDAMSDELSSIANRSGGLAQSGAALEIANKLGSRGQSGQMQQAVNESVGYNYKETTDRLSDIAANKWSLKDGITTQQLDIDLYNMKSKPGFADGLSNALAMGANVIGARLWDTSMRNKYGWTPMETGWVNAQLAELAQTHNISLLELEYQLKTKYAQDVHDINEPSDFEKGVGIVSDLADIIPGL